MVLRPLASPARARRLRRGRGSSPDQELQAFAPNPGARCLRRPSGGACAASGLGSEGWAGHWLLACCCGSGLDPSSRRRLTEADRSGGIKPDRRRRGHSLVRLDPTGPVSLAAPADATRDPAPRYVRSVGTGRAQPRQRRPPPVPPRSGGRLAWSQGPDRRRPTSVPRHAARARTSHEGRSWIPRRVGGRSQSERADGVKPGVGRPRRRRSGFTPSDRSDSVRRRRDEGSRPGPQAARDRQCPGPPLGAEAARRAGAPGGPPEASRPALGREGL